MQQASNEALAIQYRPFVRRLAQHVKHRLHHHRVELDDLEQAGLVGLIENAPRYEAKHGASFETFIGHRIRGAMIDSLRKGDWTPRPVHRAARDIARAIHDIEVAAQRPAREAEIAERLGLSLDGYRAVLHDTETRHILSIDEAPNAADTESLSPRPEHEAERERFDSDLREAIAALPERERLVIEWTFVDGMTLLEAGKVLGVGEARACQLRNQAVLRLRAKLGDWK